MDCDQKVIVWSGVDIDVIPELLRRYLSTPSAKKVGYPSMTIYSRNEKVIVVSRTDRGSIVFRPAKK